MRGMFYARTIIAIFTALGLALWLSACQTPSARYLVDTARLSGDLARLNQQFHAVESTIEMQRAVLDQRQREAVRMLVTRLNSLRRAVYMLIDQRDDTARTLVNAEQLRHLARAARGAYTEARTLVRPALPRLSPGLRADLARLDSDARRINSDIEQRLAAGGDVTDSLRRLLAIAATAARLSETALEP